MAELNPAITGDSPLTQMRLISTRSDADGMPVTITKVREAAVAMATATPPSEVVSAGIWTKTEQEPISDLLCWKVTESRVLATGSPGATVSPIIREDKWNNELGVMEAHFWQYVPDGTTKQIIGATYSTGESYVSNSITALTVNDPGSGYITIPTLTISAPNGAGTQATASVTNLRAVSAAISAAGSGYVFGDTVTVAGGTFTTAAILTVGGGTLATLAINTSSRGTGYAVGDAVRLEGGVASTTGTVTVSTVALVNAAINVAGSGYTSGGTVTLAGGTSTTKAIVSITNLKLVAVSIDSGGTGYAAGNIVLLDSGTASIKAAITVDTVDAGGDILTFTISTAGNYTVTSGTHTSTALSGIGTGATFNAALYGILNFTITTAGNYTVGATTFTQDSATGGGTGATFQSGVFGINTVAVTNGGSYSAPAVTTFTAASSSGTGTGATFQAATYTINQLTITTAGAYTVIPGSPNAVTTTAGIGTGMTVDLDFGVGTVALGTAGSTYYYPPTITPSYGSAVIAPTMSTPILLPGSPAGYVVDSALLNTEHALIKRLTWTAMPLPPTRVEQATRQFPLPNVFTWIGNWNLSPPTGFATGPFPGVHFNNVDYGVSVSPARCLISYSLGPSGSIPTTWQVITPGVSSKQFKVGPNTIHNAWIVLEWNSSYNQVTEIMPASTPASYVYGQSLIVEVTERKVIGAFYEKRVYTIN